MITCCCAVAVALNAFGLCSSAQVDWPCSRQFPEAVSDGETNSKRRARRASSPHTRTQVGLAAHSTGGLAARIHMRLLVCPFGTNSPAPVPPSALKPPRPPSACPGSQHCSAHNFGYGDVGHDQMASSRLPAATSRQLRDSDEGATPLLRPPGNG